MATKIRLSNITQPLDQDLSVPLLTAQSVNITDTTEASNTTSAALTVAGGIASQKDLIVGGGNAKIITDTSTSILTLERTGAGASQLDISLDAQKATFTSSQDGFRFIQGSSTQYEVRFGTHTFNDNSNAPTLTLANDGNATFSGDLTVSGDLLVSGNTTTLNVDTLAIEDLNITLANGAANSSVADGAGITIDGANATLTYSSSEDGFNFNKDVDITGGLDATANSSLMGITFKASGATRAISTHSSAGQLQLNGGTDNTNGAFINIAGDGYGSGDFISFYSSSNYITGNTGLGAIDPIQRLDVTGNIALSNSGTGSRFIGFYSNVVDSANNTLSAFIEKNGNNLTIYNDDSGVVQFGNNGATRMRLTSTSRLGLGSDVTSPEAAIHVQDDSNADNTLLILANDNSSDAAGDAAKIMFRLRRSYVNSVNDAGYIKVEKEQAWDESADRDASLVFGTRNGANLPDDKVWIKGNGNVGIGTSNPDQKLHVVANGTGNKVGLIIGNEDYTSGTGQTIDLQFGLSRNSGTVKNNAGLIRVGKEQDWTNDDADIDSYMSFGTYQNNAVSERMWLSSSGYLGLGVVPQSPLVVGGVNAITAHKPTGMFTDMSNGGSVTIRGLSPTLAFDKTGSNASARILLDGGALQFRDSDLDATRPNGASVTSNLLMLLSHEGKLGIGNNAFHNANAPYYNDPDYQLHVKGAGDILVEDDTGGSSHLRLRSSTSGTRNSEWKVKVSGAYDEFYVDHDYTASGTAITEKTTAFKIDGKNNLYNDNYQVTIKPVLNLDFANTKSLDPRIDFARPSIGTYYDAKGVLRYASRNKPRFNHDPNTKESLGLLIEEARTNLHKDGLVPNNWTLNTSKVTIRQHAALAPDNTYSAYGVYTFDTAGDHYVQCHMASSETLTYTTPRTVSVYVKAANMSAVQIRNVSQTGTFSYYIVNFDLTDGSIISSSAANATDTTYDKKYIGNGWWRVSVTCSFTLSNVTQSRIEIQPHDGTTHAYAGSNATDIYIWGPQIEPGTNMSSYIPAETIWTGRSSRASYFDKNGVLKFTNTNNPRYGYKYDADNDRWVETGLIVENNTINRIINSAKPDAFEQGGSEDQYYSSELDIAGGNRAQKISAGLSGYTLCSGLQGQTRWTYSAYVKSAGATGLGFYADASAITAFSFYFDSTTGEPLSGYTLGNSLVGYGSEKLDNGWWRIWVNIETDSDGGTIAPRMACSGGDMIYCFPQLESGMSPTSYIPTFGEQRTRTADTTTLYVTTREIDFVEIDNARDIIPQHQGTVFTEWNTEEITGNYGGVFELWESGSNGIDQRTSAYYLTNNYALSFGNYTQHVFRKTAIAYDDSSVLDSRAAADGTLQATDTTHTWTMNMTKIRLGSIDLSSAYMLNGHLKSFKLYDQRLSDNELITLTEID